jgi:beta-glucosidase
MKPRPIWGAATSAHQVEGGNRWNDWWAWEGAGKVREPSGQACDHYRLFREDFRLARSLGHTGHRFSLEWSRLEPSEGSWNEEAFRHYDEVFDALEAEGLEPVVTLHHYTNPLWFAQKGGWLHPDAVRSFAEFVERVARRFGRRVKYWVTLNEPLIYIYYSFVLGTWPPGEQSFDKATVALRQLLKAHVAAYQRLHEHSKNSECWVSVAHHTTALTPCRPHSPLDRFNLFLRDWFVNRLVFGSLQSGVLFYPGVFSEKLPAKGTLDYLGVNYYTRNFIRFDGFRGARQFGTVCPHEHHRDKIREVNDMDWEICPEGLYGVLRSFRSLNLPILITENGVCVREDAQRQRYIERHLGMLERLQGEGLSIFGYFYWSLVDNFEWAEGFRPRFGIVEVDYQNQARRPRPSAETLRQGCEKLFKGNQ